MGQTIDLIAKDGHTFSAYRADPEGTPRGGIVVLQEIWGVNDHIRKVTDGYAAEGYTAIAPALFDRVERHLTMDAYNGETRERDRCHAEGRPRPGPAGHRRGRAGGREPPGKVGIVGFCFGGRMAWLAAARVDGVGAAAAYYGGGIPGMVGEKPRCPVIFHFGERDHGIPVASVEAFSQAHPSLPVFMYPADHGFNCDQRGAYDAPSAKLARERTLEFLRKTLR